MTKKMIVKLLLVAITPPTLSVTCICFQFPSNGSLNCQLLSNTYISFPIPTSSIWRRAVKWSTPRTLLNQQYRPAVGISNAVYTLIGYYFNQSLVFTFVLSSPKRATFAIQLKKLKIKSVAHSSQGSHTGKLDFCNRRADGSTTG